MKADGLERKTIASRLGISRQAVDYHLKFNRPNRVSAMQQMEGQLANALTREMFLRESLRFQEQMYRRLWWETKSSLTAPIIKHLR
jgi:predicted transcriptional regulator